MVYSIPEEQRTMCRYPLLILAVFVSACFPELELTPYSDGVEVEDTQEPGLVIIELSAAEPFHGSNSGGLETVIEGGPFDDSLRVWFDEEEAEVLAVSETVTTVRVPATDEEGVVSIRVETDTGVGSAAQAFRYWKDRTGEVVMTSLLAQWEWEGPSIPDVVESGFYQTAQLIQLEGGDWSILDGLGPSVDFCGAGETPSGVVELPDQSIFTGGTIELILEPYEGVQGHVYGGELDVPDLQGTIFSLDIPDGGQYPEQFLDGTIFVPDGVKMLSPDILEHGYYDYKDFIYLETSPVTWTGASGDYVLLQLVDAYGSEESFSCVLENDGQHQLTLDDFAAFNAQWSDRLVHYTYAASVRLLDLHVTETTLDFNNGTALMVGGAGVWGYGYFAISWD